MKKLITSFTCVALLAMPAMALADSEDVNLIVNSQVVYGDEASGQPYISEAGRTMIPLRMVNTAMNYQTDWQADGSIHITSPDGAVDVSLKVGQGDYTANGEVGQFESLPLLKNDRTYLPARDFSELYGQIYWEEDSRTVWISQTEGTDYQVVGDKLLRADEDGIQEVALPEEVTLPAPTATDPIVAERTIDGKTYLGLMVSDDRSQAMALVRDDGDQATYLTKVFGSSSFYVQDQVVYSTDGTGAGGWSHPIHPNRLYVTDLAQDTTKTYELDFAVHATTLDMVDGKLVATDAEGKTYEIDLGA